MFADYIKKDTEEGKEKHVPFIAVSNCSTCGELGVVIKVGEEVFHPSTPEHYIESIEIFGVLEDGKISQVTRFELGKENTIPYVKTHLKKGTFKKLIVLSICNIHGVWENEIDI